jgi:hypothetical protein
MQALALIASVLTNATVAMQFPERHFASKEGKNVCIYPIDEAPLSCAAIHDFQVEYHVPANASVPEEISDVVSVPFAVRTAKSRRRRSYMAPSRRCAIGPLRRSRTPPTILPLATIRIRRHRETPLFRQKSASVPSRSTSSRAASPQRWSGPSGS